MTDDEGTPEGRQAILARMRAASRTFYGAAFTSGCHAFVEFAGLMNEFIKLCEEAERAGIDWMHASGHVARLPFQPYNIEYLNTKLECIYGVRLEHHPAMASKGGKARAAKLSPKRRSEIARAGGKARAAKRTKHGAGA